MRWPVTIHTTKDINNMTKPRSSNDDGSPTALLERQREHADRYKGQTESQGGRDYPATDVERDAGGIRIPYYEQLIADAANQADQDAIDSTMEEYHEARLKLAQKRSDKRED